MKMIILALLLAATQPSTRPAENWGTAVEGVQVMLRAEQQVYRAGETPAFLVSARNAGNRDDLSIPLSGELWVIEVDGKRYQWFGDGEMKSTPFPPGKRVDDVAISFKGDWAPLDKGEFAHLKLKPGKHRLRVVLTADARHPARLDVEAISNAIEFHIVDAK
jgi:hypothetical protein